MDALPEIIATAASLAALLGGMYAVVTRPMLAAMNARFDAVDRELADIDKRLAGVEELHPRTHGHL